MKSHLVGITALAVCLMFCHAPKASAQRDGSQRSYQMAGSSSNDDGVSLAGYNKVDSNSCGNCSQSCGCGDSGGGLLSGPGLLDRPGSFFAGAEYIYARASFSEAPAYVITDGNAAPQNAGQEFVEHDFNYKSSYRLYGGYRLCDCGGEIAFNFGRYTSDSNFAIQEQPGQTILSPYEIDGPGTDGVVSGSANVDIRSYDLGFSKTIPLGSPLCCDCGCGDTCCGDGCGDSCCGDGCGGCGCGGGWCPAWDITWSAGLRFADVGWNRGSLAATPAGDQIDRADTQLNFEGAGARVGMLGRRYLGKRGFASIYAKGDISLLVGDMNIRTDTTNDPDAATPVAFRSHGNSARRVIPVTEIEAGVTAHLGDRIQLSSGYFIAAWHDLGMRDTYHFGNAFQLGHYDDANILGFDGYFARAEISF